MQRSNRLTLFILIAMATGIVTGALIHSGVQHHGMPESMSINSVGDLGKASAESGQPAKNMAAELKTISDSISIVTTVFLNLIRMIIAPLVLSTLIVGIAKMGNMNSVGRVGGKTIAWFITASLVSLVLGMVIVNIFQPGIHMHLSLPPENAKALIDTKKFNITDFITHVFPTSIVKSMSENEILQIVVFCIFFGVATAAIGEKGLPIIHALDSVMHIMLKMTGYVIRLAPIAVLASFTSLITIKGISVLATYGLLIAEFYFGLLLLWSILITAGYIVLRKRVFTLLKRIREPFLIAFSTSSSEAAFPRFIEELERFGCGNKIVSFVLPLGYSFNLDGSMMFMTFGSLFIAQSYGIHLDWGTQISMLLVLMLTSKGIAGVPKASLVVVSATLVMFGIPEAGIGLIFGIDTFLDMGRSATNIIGNAIATAAVSKWENELE